MFEKLDIPQELIPSDPRFGSGPSLVPVEFIRRLLETDVNLLGTSHRASAVKDLVAEVQSGISTYFKLPSDYTVVLGNGGATFLFDMIAIGLVKNCIVHNTCGEFSNKWYKSSANVPWIKAVENTVDYGLPVVPVNLEGEADCVAITLNETSTGVQSTALPKLGEDQLLLVDATSGAGQIPMDVSKTDVFFFSPQKVFASEGGLFVAIMSPRAVERARELAKDKSHYRPVIMDWNLAIDNSVKHQTYNTPSISTLFFLNEQVKLMNELGSDQVFSTANKKAELVYSWAKEKDYLSSFVGAEEGRSLTVATIDVDDKYPVENLIKNLAKEKVVNGIGAYRKLGRNQFRISLFHNISFEDLEKLTKLISHLIETV
jgi:phosphoserine aminotransferase